MSTTDSGVATRAGIRPALADERELDRAIGRLQALLGEAEQRTDDLDERDVVARLARQRLVDEGDRADPPHRLADGGDRLGVRQPPRLQPQQRRDRLQVVLDAVVDLADRRVLAHQQPVALAEVGDVTEQEHPAGDLVGRQDRHALAQQHDVGSLLELLDDRHAGLERPAHDVVVEAELGEAHPHGVGVDADAVHRRVGVRRQVADPRVGVDDEHTVADSRRRRGVDDSRSGVRKRAVGDHRREAVEQRQVLALQLAGDASGLLDPLPGHHGDRVVAVAHRDGEHPRRVVLLLDGDVALGDLAGAQHRG